MRSILAATVLVLVVGCGSNNDPKPIPSSPANVLALPASGAATLTWDAVSGASAYNVYYAPAGTVVSTSSSKVTVATNAATVTGMANGSAYAFAVSAVGPGGESALSSEACAVPTAAATAGLVLYDALCGDQLDGTRWLQPGAAEARVANGAGEFTVDVGNQESRTLRNNTYQSLGNVATTQRVSTITADVTVPSGAITRSGSAQVRALLRLLYSPPLNRLTFPGANLDLLVLEVGLVDAGDGLRAFRNIVHCDDASCATISTSGVDLVDPAGFQVTGSVAFGPAANFDTPYTVTVSLDEASGRFTWSIGGGSLSGVSGTADPTAYLTSNATAWAGAPLAGSGFFVAQVGVRTLDNSQQGGGAGRITARFDNVLVGLNNAAATPWDDFSGTGSNSGRNGEFSPTRWTGTAAAPGNGTRTLLLSDGTLVDRLQLTNTAAVTLPPAVTAALGRDSTGGTDQSKLWNTVQADVYVTSATMGAVFLDGRFYNDGSPGTAPVNTNRQYSQVGDVVARLQLNPVANSATWSVLRCTTANGGCTGIGSGTVAASLGGTNAWHTLRLSWDPGARTFGFAVDASAVTVDPKVTGNGMTSAAPYAGPANAPWRQLGTAMAVASGASGSIDARFNNVFVAP